MKHTRAIRLVTLLLLVVGGLAAWLWPDTEGGQQEYLTVRFLDVGQGDAIFIETPDGIQALVDGGPDGTVMTELGTYMPWFDDSIDVVLGTHQDLDHVTGLVDVLAHYRVGLVIMQEGKGASAAANAFVTAAQTKADQFVYARTGQEYQLGASTTLTILSPASNPEAWASNAGSIVVMLRYGTTSFLLTGDAPQGIEEYLVRAFGPHLTATVLKLGHHGSDSSSSDTFLRSVDPEYVVVSAGKDNKYGHPAAAVLTRVASDTTARVVRTDESGTITFYSDGTQVWVK